MSLKTILSSKSNIALFLTVLIVFTFGFVSLTNAQCCPQFNNCTGDLELLRLKNRTQGTVNWQDPVSANCGDTVAFDVYYHNCVTGTTAENTKIRLDFPTTDLTQILVNAYLWADNASYVSDTGTINVSSAQRLNFASTAQWYPNQTTTPTTIPVTQLQANSIQVDIGDIQGNWTYQGHVVFEATLTPCTSSPSVDIKANSSDGPISIPYNSSATLSWTTNNVTSCYAYGGWSGTKAISGSEGTGNLTTSKTYTLTCTGTGGTVSDSVTVNVSSYQPTVDIKANGYDGPVTIPYNTSAILSWTSANATSCAAYGGWSGTKSTSGSESTGNLTTSKTYTITCSGTGGTISDSVTVQTSYQYENLYVTLEAIPNSGSAPLNDVDLKATVSGTTSGTINYKFDCQNDGIWDYIYNSVWDNPKTVFDACDYSAVGTYTAKVYVERGAVSPAQNTTQITVSSSSGATLSTSKWVRNLSDGTGWLDTASADPGEVLTFLIYVTAGGSSSQNVTVKDVLPSKITYQGDLKVDNLVSGGDIISGLNLGNLSPGQTKTITFNAIVAGASQFSYGTTELINTAQAYSASSSTSDTAKVNVSRSAVAGAATGITTGVSYLHLSLIIVFLLSLTVYLLVVNLEKSQDPTVRKFLKICYRIKSFIGR